MATPPVENPTEVWQRFCTDVQRLLEHPLASPEDSLSHLFDSWGSAVLATWLTPSFTETWAAAWSDLANDPETQQAAVLLLRELAAFSAYVDQLMPRLDQQYQLQDQEAPEMRERLSILSTILDSLCELFPTLKGLFKAGMSSLKLGATSCDLGRSQMLRILVHFSRCRLTSA